MKPVREYPFFRITDLAIPVIIVFLLVTVRDRAGETNNCRLDVHSGEGIDHYELQADSVFSVAGNLGGIEIEIKDEMARIAHSPCPGQDCVEQGWISSPGELSVCVPSGVFIVINGINDSLDAVSY